MPISGEGCAVPISHTISIEEGVRYISFTPLARRKVCSTDESNYHTEEVHPGRYTFSTNEGEKMWISHTIST